MPLLVQKQIRCTGNSIRGTSKCRSVVDLHRAFYAYGYVGGLSRHRSLLLSHTTTATATIGQCALGWWINISNTCLVNHHEILGFQVCRVRYLFETDRWCVIIWSCGKCVQKHIYRIIHIWLSAVWVGCTLKWVCIRDSVSAIQIQLRRCKSHRILFIWCRKITEIALDYST